MSKVILYTGQAGTGKTTSLMQLLSQTIPLRKWDSFETVLALTFMHGSRRRLDTSLKFVKKTFNVRYQCSTIDSFVLNLTNRFRVYLGITKMIFPAETNTESLFEQFLTRDKIRELAISLLSKESVKNYISNSYPIIVVDEFQDCTGSLLDIIKGLASTTTLFIAADPFQQLSDPENLDGIQWIKDSGYQHNDLDVNGNHRTTDDRILRTASCLRSGVIQAGKKIDIYPCPGGRGGTFGLAEYQLKAQIHYNLRHGSVAIISPTANCVFVENLLKSLAKPYTYKKPPYKTIGPYSHLILPDHSIDFEKLIKEFAVRELDKNELLTLRLDDRLYVRKCADKLLKRMSLRDIPTICFDEFSYVLEQSTHTYNNFYNNSNQGKIIFSTIHGAKNREFDTVIILWSYKATGTLIQKRKLLYNAITRAKKNVSIIVQHKNDKLEDLAKTALFSLIIDPPLVP